MAGHSPESVVACEAGSLLDGEKERKFPCEFTQVGEAGCLFNQRNLIGGLLQNAWTHFFINFDQLLILSESFDKFIV